MMLSIVIPVLNSHEVVRRQLLHLETSGLPDGVEVILVDDGSDPPIENTSSLPVTIHRTGDTREWTWALARNAGARLAKGEWLLMYDLDHIATRELIEFILDHPCPGMHFRREFGVLDENGVLTQDRGVLAEYGLLPRKSLRIESHHNSFAIRKEVFWGLGGYREDLIGQPYPQGEDSGFWKRWNRFLEMQGLSEPFQSECPTLYVFPTGRWCGDVDFNPQHLFHELSRKSPRNYHWHQQRKRECQTDSQKT